MKNALLIARRLSALMWVSLPLLAADAPREARDTLGQWVETKQLITSERSDWAVEASILKDTRQLLGHELQRLNQALTDLQDTATAADEERTQLAELQESRTQAAAVVQDRIGALEAQLKAILPTLPPPLLEQIQPLIRRLPDASTANEANLGERVQNIVGILNQAEKFNAGLTGTSETRRRDDGQIIEVRTLYWGLAQAYFVDQSGDYAGIGSPSPTGWEWLQIDGVGPKIKQLLEIYEGGDIQLVEVPVQIK